MAARSTRGASVGCVCRRLAAAVAAPGLPVPPAHPGGSGIEEVAAHRSDELAGREGWARAGFADTRDTRAHARSLVSRGVTDPSSQTMTHGHNKYGPINVPYRLINSLTH